MKKLYIIALLVINTIFLASAMGVEDEWPTLDQQLIETVMQEKINVEKIKSFLNDGANVNAKGEDGWTPLHWVASGGYAEATEFLLEYDAKLDAEDEDSWTPLHWAANEGHKKIIELLLGYGAKIDARAEYGYTPLHIAVSSGCVDVVKFLIKSGFKVSAKDDFGGTSLHVAAFKDCAGVVELLIESDAEVTVKNDFNITPLYYAASKGCIDIIKLLLTAPIVFQTYNSLGGKRFKYGQYFEFFNKISKEAQDQFMYMVRKKHLSIIQKMILLKSNKGEAAMDIVCGENNEIVKYFNKIVIAKKYADLDKDLKDEIEKSYKKRLVLGR